MKLSYSLIIWWFIISLPRIPSPSLPRTSWPQLGPECLQTMPLLVDLQNSIISLPGIQAFIKSPLYFPIGDANYVAQVQRRDYHIHSILFAPFYIFFRWRKSLGSHPQLLQHLVPHSPHLHHHRKLLELASYYYCTTPLFVYRSLKIVHVFNLFVDSAISRYYVSLFLC